jgi:membrane-bound serine protease (ClpP class)
MSNLGKIFLAASLIFSVFLCANSYAQESARSAPPQKRKVAVIPVSGEVDNVMYLAMKRRVKEAQKSGAELIIFQIDTYGGMLDSAEEIVEYLNSLNGVKTMAFVFRRALSAGAYISLACNEIAIQPEATLGDCKPILITGEEPGVPEKIESPLRAKFRALAEKNHYPAVLAVAMVSAKYEVVKIAARDTSGKTVTEFVERDEVNKWVTEKTNQGMEIVSEDVVVKKGELLTMTGPEAKELGFAKYVAPTLGELLQMIAENYLAGAQVRNYYEVLEVSIIKVTWWEHFIKFLSSGLVKALLLAIGILALYVEFKAPGLGLPAAVGILCLFLVFFSSYLAGLATVIEILMIVAGIILLLLEIFVIPGFGVPGVAGFILIIAGTLLSFQNFTLPRTPYEFSVVTENVAILVTDLFAVIVIAALLAKYLPKTRQFSRIMLAGPDAGTLTGDAAAQTRGAEIVGKHGIALTKLRPAGKAKIAGQFLDVVTEGDFINEGTKIRVRRTDGNRIVVEEEKEQ